MKELEERKKQRGSIMDNQNIQWTDILSDKAILIYTTKLYSCIINLIITTYFIIIMKVYICYGRASSFLLGLISRNSIISSKDI